MVTLIKLKGDVRMKRVLSIFMIVVLSVLAFTACTPETSTPNDSGNQTANTGKEQGSQPQKAPAEDKKVKAAFLGWRFGDKGFNELAVSGVKRADNDFDNLEINAIDITTDPKNFVPSLLEACDAGYDIIALAAFEFGEILDEYAPQYPDITFILLDGECNYDAVDLPNVYSATFLSNESAFLAGMTAAYITEKTSLEGINPEKVIGFVGGQDNVPSIFNFYIGFVEGATYYDPEIKVTHSYVNSFDDSAKAKELALTQYNAMNADIVFHASGAAGLGVFEAAYETGKYAIGCNTDQTQLFEGRRERDRIVTSTMIGVDQGLYNAFKAYMEGNLETGKQHTLGISQDIGGLADNELFRSYVDSDFLAKLNEAKGKIKAGEIKVTSAFDVPTDFVRQLEAKVKP